MGKASIMDLKIGKIMSSGPAMRASMFGSTIQPMYSDFHGGIDFEARPRGESVFIFGLDAWGNKRKRVGR